MAWEWRGRVRVTACQGKNDSVTKNQKSQATVLSGFLFSKCWGKKKKIPQIHLLGRNNGAEVVFSIDVKTIIQNMAPFLFCAGSRGALGQHLWTDQMDGRLCHEQLKKFLTQLNKFLVSLPASMEFPQPEFQAPSI